MGLGIIKVNAVIDIYNPFVLYVAYYHIILFYAIPIPHIFGINE